MLNELIVHVFFFFHFTSTFSIFIYLFMLIAETPSYSRATLTPIIIIINLPRNVRTSNATHTTHTHTHHIASHIRLWQFTDAKKCCISWWRFGVNIYKYFISFSLCSSSRKGKTALSHVWCVSRCKIVGIVVQPLVRKNISIDSQKCFDVAFFNSWNFPFRFHS